jgi:hypothetical protein
MTPSGVPSPAEKEQKEFSRRSFLRLSGAVAAAGVIGIGLGYPADLVTVPKADGTNADPVVRSRASPHTIISTRPSPAATPFSIFWITDTQFLSESNPALFSKMTNWIVANWGAHNGKMVVHTGDIVQTGSVQTEWENADAAMSVLLENGIPYTWCAGNHDDLVGDDPTSGWSGDQWTSAFNPSVVKRALGKLDHVHWADDYHDGMNTAVAFSTNDLDFLIINIEWNADAGTTLKWVEGLLNNPRYVDHHVIIAPHAYIDETGSADYAEWGPELSAFVKPLTALMNRNSYRIFLTLNGHFPTDYGYHTPNMMDGRNELMFDRQDSTDDPDQPMATPTTPDWAKIGGATVTILTFDPERNLVSVKTYDVCTGKYRDDPQERFAFTMFPTATSTRPITGMIIPTPVSGVTILR